MPYETSLCLPIFWIPFNTLQQIRLRGYIVFRSRRIWDVQLWIIFRDHARFPRVRRFALADLFARRSVIIRLYRRTSFENTGALKRVISDVQSVVPWTETDLFSCLRGKVSGWKAGQNSTSSPEISFSSSLIGSFGHSSPLPSPGSAPS